MENKHINPIRRLLQETAEAHHQAFIAVDGADPEWPRWYAEHLHGPLTGLLHEGLAVEALATLLEKLDKEHRQQASGEEWATAYARGILEAWRTL